MNDDFIVKMIGERDLALLSLDADRILAYMDKYSPDVAQRMRGFLKSNPDLFWAAVHKARCQVTTFRPKVYIESAQWLKAHNFNVPPREYEHGRQS